MHKDNTLVLIMRLPMAFTKWLISASRIKHTLYVIHLDVQNNLLEPVIWFVVSCHSPRVCYSFCQPTKFIQVQLLSYFDTVAYLYYSSVSSSIFRVIEWWVHALVDWSLWYVVLCIQPYRCINLCFSWPTLFDSPQEVNMSATCCTLACTKMELLVSICCARSYYQLGIYYLWLWIPRPHQLLNP